MANSDEIKTRTYSGPDRRMDEDHHDNVCDRRLGPLRSLVYIIVTAVVLSGGYTYSQNEGMKSKNDTQDLRIDETTKDLAKVEATLEAHIQAQNAVNGEMLRILNVLKTDMAVVKREVQ